MLATVFVLRPSVADFGASGIVIVWLVLCLELVQTQSGEFEPRPMFGQIESASQRDVRARACSGPIKVFVSLAADAQALREVWSCMLFLLCVCSGGEFPKRLSCDQCHREKPDYVRRSFFCVVHARVFVVGGERLDDVLDERAWMCLSCGLRSGYALCPSRSQATVFSFGRGRRVVGVQPKEFDKRVCKITQLFP